MRIERPRQHKEKITQPVQIAGAVLLFGVPQAPLRAAAYASTDVRVRCAGAPARQDELGQRRQGAVHRLGVLFEKFSGWRRYLPERGQMCAEIEQLLLNLLQRRIEIRIVKVADQHAEVAVELVDVTHRREDRLVLRQLRAVCKARFAAVALARGDFRDAVFCFRHQTTRLDGCCQARVVRLCRDDAGLEGM